MFKPFVQKVPEAQASRIPTSTHSCTRRGPEAAGLVTPAGTLVSLPDSWLAFRIRTGRQGLGL